MRWRTRPSPTAGSFRSRLGRCWPRSSPFSHRTRRRRCWKLSAWTRPRSGAAWTRSPARNPGPVPGSAARRRVATMSEFGFGIVGAGTIAEFHAEAIGLVPGARLGAVADVDQERARKLTAKHGSAAEAGLDQLLGRDDVDVVAVCVPSGQHAAVGVRAAAAGKHLVIEKPIDVSLEAADRLIAAAGVTATVISQHRFDPGLIELRRLINRGTL